MGIGLIVVMSVESLRGGGYVASRCFVKCGSVCACCGVLCSRYGVNMSSRWL